MWDEYRKYTYAGHLHTHMHVIHDNCGACRGREAFGYTSHNSYIYHYIIQKLCTIFPYAPMPTSPKYTVLLLLSFAVFSALVHEMRKKMLLLFIVVFRCCHVGNIFPFATCPSSRYTHRTGEMIREISKHFWIGIEAWRSRRSCRLWLWSYTPVTYFCRCRRRSGHLAHAQCGWASHPLRNRKKNNNRHKERKRDTHIYIYIYMFLMIRSTITYNDVEDMFIRAQNGNHILQDATK